MLGLIGGLALGPEGLAGPAFLQACGSAFHRFGSRAPEREGCGLCRALRPGTDRAGPVAQVSHFASQRDRAGTQRHLCCGRFAGDRLQRLANVALALGQFRGIGLFLGRDAEGGIFKRPGFVTARCVAMGGGLGGVDSGGQLLERAGRSLARFCQ